MNNNEMAAYVNANKLASCSQKVLTWHVMATQSLFLTKQQWFQMYAYYVLSYSIQRICSAFQYGTLLGFNTNCCKSVFAA